MNRKTVKWWKKTLFSFVRIMHDKCAKTNNIPRKTKSLKFLLLFSYTVHVCEALTAVNERAICSTQISFQFTPENFHRCEKIDPTKPKLQHECVVCKHKL